MWPCIKCQQPTARIIEGISTWRHISYYRCASCGEVWTIDRRDPGNPKMTIVTEHDDPTKPLIRLP